MPYTLRPLWRAINLGAAGAGKRWRVDRKFKPEEQVASLPEMLQCGFMLRRSPTGAQMEQNEAELLRYRVIRQLIEILFSGSRLCDFGKLVLANRRSPQENAYQR